LKEYKRGEGNVEAVRDIKIITLQKDVKELEEKYKDLDSRLKIIDQKITWGFLAVLVLQIISKVVG